MSWNYYPWYEVLSWPPSTSEAMFWRTILIAGQRIRRRAAPSVRSSQVNLNYYLQQYLQQFVDLWKSSDFATKPATLATMSTPPAANGIACLSSTHSLRTSTGSLLTLSQIQTITCVWALEMIELRLLRMAARGLFLSLRPWDLAILELQSLTITPNWMIVKAAQASTERQLQKSMRRSILGSSTFLESWASTFRKERNLPLKSRRRKSWCHRGMRSKR